MGNRNDEREPSYVARKYADALVENWRGLSDSERKEFIQDEMGSEYMPKAEEFLEILDEAWATYSQRNKKFKDIDNELQDIMDSSRLSSGGKKKPAKEKPGLSSGRTRDPNNDGFLRETDYNDPDAGYGLVPRLMKEVGFEENEARDAMDYWNSLDDDEMKEFEDARDGDVYGAISDAWDESQAATPSSEKLSSGRKGSDRRTPMDDREKEMFKNNAAIIEILDDMLPKNESWDDWVDNEFRDADGTDQEKHDSVFGPTTDQELIDFAKQSDEPRSDASDQEYFDSIYETAAPIDKLQYVAEYYQPLGARYGSVEHQEAFIR